MLSTDVSQTRAPVPFPLTLPAPFAPNTGGGNTFPLVLSTDVSETRAPVLLQALVDGRYLDRRLTQQLSIEVWGGGGDTGAWEARCWGLGGGGEHPAGAGYV